MSDKQHPFDAPPDVRAVCYQCGHMSSQLYDYTNGVYRCYQCVAEQCKRVRCTQCGKTCTRPEGAHYCSGSRYKPENAESKPS